MSGAAGSFRAPPGWPRPPRGWSPPPGWSPDPRWPPAPPGWRWFDPAPPTRWALDAQVREAKRRAGAAWTQGAAWWPVLGLVVVMLAGGAIAAAWTPPRPWDAIWGAALNVGAYGALLVLGLRVGARAARAGGGWAATFGLMRPRWLDAPLGLAGAGVEFAARIVVGVLLLLALPALRDADPSNLDLEGMSGVELTLSAVLVILVAPPVEEFLFRGLMLRTLMTRMRFWPAALTSSVVFAVFHAPAVETWSGAVVLVASILVFALGQCLLVRWRASLVPAAVAHAIGNGVAFGLSVLLLG